MDCQLNYLHRKLVSEKRTMVPQNLDDSFKQIHEWTAALVSAITKFSDSGDSGHRGQMD